MLTSIAPMPLFVLFLDLSYNYLSPRHLGLGGPGTIE